MESFRISFKRIPLSEDDCYFLTALWFSSTSLKTWTKLLLFLFLIAVIHFQCTIEIQTTPYFTAIIINYFSCHFLCCSFFRIWARWTEQRTRYWTSKSATSISNKEPLPDYRRNWTTTFDVSEVRSKFRFSSLKWKCVSHVMSKI